MHTSTARSHPCSLLHAAGFLTSRGKALLPDFPAAFSLATNLFASAVGVLGVVGALLWCAPPSTLRTQLGATLMMYHGTVVTVSTSHVVASEPGAEEIQAGLGAAMFHGSLFVWLATWLLKQQANAGIRNRK